MAMMDTSAVSSRMAACAHAGELIRSTAGQRRAHLQLREVHQAVGLHREVGDVPPRLLQVAARVQHALVVRLACDDVTLVTIKLRDALDGHVVALRGSLRGAAVSGAGGAARSHTNRSEDDFLGVGADEVRHALARKLHRLLTLPAVQVRAAVRVAELLDEERQHGIKDTRVHRRRRLRRA